MGPRFCESCLLYWLSLTTGASSRPKAHLLADPCIIEVLHACFDWQNRIRNYLCVFRFNPLLYTIEVRHGDFRWTIRRRYHHFRWIKWNSNLLLSGYGGEGAILLWVSLLSGLFPRFPWRNWVVCKLSATVVRTMDGTVAKVIFIICTAASMQKRRCPATPSMVYNGHAITNIYSPPYRLYRRGCVNHIKEFWGTH